MEIQSFNKRILSLYFFIIVIEMLPSLLNSSPTYFQFHYPYGHIRLTYLCVC